MNNNKEWSIENAKKFRELLIHKASIPDAPPLTRGEKGAIIGAMNRRLGNDELRKRVLAYWFSDSAETMSTKELTNEQWRALFDACGFYQDEQGAWHTDQTFLDACLFTLPAVTSIEYGKTYLVIDNDEFDNLFE